MRVTFSSGSAGVFRGFPRHQPERSGGGRREQTAHRASANYYRSSKCTRPMSPVREVNGRWDGCLGWGWLHTATRIR